MRNMQHVPSRQIHNRKMLPQRLHLPGSTRGPMRRLRKTQQLLRINRPKMQTMQKHSNSRIINALLLRTPNSRKQT